MFFSLSPTPTDRSLAALPAFEEFYASLAHATVSHRDAPGHARRYRFDGFRPSSRATTARKASPLRPSPGELDERKKDSPLRTWESAETRRRWLSPGSAPGPADSRRARAGGTCTCSGHSEPRPGILAGSSRPSSRDPTPSSPSDFLPSGAYYPLALQSRRLSASPCRSSSQPALDTSQISARSDQLIVWA